MPLTRSVSGDTRRKWTWSKGGGHGGNLDSLGKMVGWQPLGDSRHGVLYPSSSRYSFSHGSNLGRWKSYGAFVWSCRSLNDSKSSA